MHTGHKHCGNSAIFIPVPIRCLINEYIKHLLFFILVNFSKLPSVQSPKDKKNSSQLGKLTRDHKPYIRVHIFPPKCYQTQDNIQQDSATRYLSQQVQKAGKMIPQGGKRKQNNPHKIPIFFKRYCKFLQKGLGKTQLPYRTKK